MNGRVLVWPWHGLLQGGQIKLADDSYRTHPQPPASLVTLGLCGPGDTHHIVVPGVEPISAAEAALAPAGGEFWAGEALLSGGMLYGHDLSGWIYQATDGARWWVRVQGVSVGGSLTTGTFRLRRFGHIGGTPDDKTVPFTLPAGTCTAAEATRIGANLGGAGAGFLRLHAVSQSGRTAVLALVTRNVGASFDRRPRAYRFYRVDLVDASGVVEIAVAELYGMDDIEASTSSQPSGYVRMTDVPWTEVGRQPFYNSSGTLIAYDVSYIKEGESGFEPTSSVTSFVHPGEYSYTRRLLVQVRFDGETPVPVSLQVSAVRTLPWPSLAWATALPEIRREYIAGTTDVIQPGRVRLTGGVITEYTAYCSVGAWMDEVEVRSTSVVDTGVYESGGGLPTTFVTLTHEITGAAGSVTVVSSGGGAQIGNTPAMIMSYDGSNRWPVFTGTAGVPGLSVPIAYRVGIDLLSNNLLATAGQIGGGAQSYLAVVAQGAARPYSGAYLGVSAYGSYNPATDEFAIATTPVNWI